MSTMVSMQYVSTFMSKQMIITMILVLLTNHGFAASINDDHPDTPMSYNCPKSGFRYSLGSAFHENLNHTLFTEFSSSSALKTSSNFTIGRGIDQVYALYYCRGDIDTNTCHRCIQAAVTKLVEVCKFLKQGIVWYEECTLRYANHPIFSLDEVSPFYLHNNRTSLVSEYHLDPYKKVFDNTMKGLVNEAAYNERLGDFAVKEINLSLSQTLRGFAQCSPYISSTLCENCLTVALKQMHVWYITMAYLPSCVVRYDLYGSPLPPPPSSDDGPVSLPARYQVLIALLSVLLILSLLGGFWFWRHRRSKGPTNATEKQNNIKDSTEVDSNMSGSKREGFTRFTYSQVQEMTNRLQRRLGEGAYGVVFYGRLANGREVAVKMLSKSDAPKQFSNEIEVFGRISHKNLVSLYGYCQEGAVLALIYEYMPKGDLQDLLSEHSDATLSWKKRLEIALDTAQGLEYLHNHCSPPILHRDVKPANILLNQHLQAKVADFGHSRIFPAEYVSRLTATIVGTPGYVDPQYYATGLVNERSDVYSFGVVLLELITGQKAIISTGTNLVHWVRPLFDRGDIGSILDPKLRIDVGENYNSVWRVTELAKKCVEIDGKDRPTMTQIIMELRDCMVLENMDTCNSSSNPNSSEMISEVHSFNSMHPRPR